MPCNIADYYNYERDKKMLEFSTTILTRCCTQEKVQDHFFRCRPLLIGRGGAHICADDKRLQNIVYVIDEKTPYKFAHSSEAPAPTCNRSFPPTLDPASWEARKMTLRAKMATIILGLAFCASQGKEQRRRNRQT